MENFSFEKTKFSFDLNGAKYIARLSNGKFCFFRQNRELFSTLLKQAEFQIIYLYFNDKPSFWIKDGLSSLSIYLDNEKIQIINQDSVFTHYID